MSLLSNVKRKLDLETPKGGFWRKADLWTATYAEYNLDTPVGPLFCIAPEATTLGKVGEVTGVILDTGEVLRCEPDTRAVRSITVGSGPLVRLPIDRCKMVAERNHLKDTGRDGAAFLLAQVGAHAASKFAARMQSFDLTPALVGVLRFLARNPGSSQRELAEAIGMPASRLVAMADELERRELVIRVRDEHDRRSHRITLTGAGKAQLEAIAKQAQEHKRELLSALSVEEQEQLEHLLQRIAHKQGLKRGVHPGLTRGRPS